MVGLLYIPELSFNFNLFTQLRSDMFLHSLLPVFIE